VNSRQTNLCIADQTWTTSLVKQMEWKRHLVWSEEVLAKYLNSFATHQTHIYIIKARQYRTMQKYITLLFHGFRSFHLS